MADAYQALGLSVEPQDAVDEMVEELQARVPGWTPAAGSLIMVVFEVVALQIARLLAAIEDTARELFAAFGEELVRVARLVVEPATGRVVVTASHSDGLVIHAGTQFSGSDGAGGTVIFQSTEQAVIPAGSTTSGDIPVEAIDPGLIAGPVSGAAVLETGLEGVESAAFSGSTSRGANGETLEEYIQRLALMLRLLKIGPVTAADYPLFLRTMLTAPHRVLVRDGYDPSDSSEGNPGVLTISMIDASGVWVGSGVDADAAQLLGAYELVDAVTHFVKPTTSTIDVEYEVIVEAGYDPVEVLAACDAALSVFLDPSGWGLPPIGDEPGWVLKRTLRPMGMLGPVIGSVEGVESVESVEARVAADSQQLEARVARGSNLTVSNPGTSTIDGVTVTNGDVLLLTGQSSPAQNGLWVFNGSSSALTRPTVFPNGGSVQEGLLVSVSEGGSFEDSVWRLTSSGAHTIDTTSQTWTQEVLSSSVITLNGHAPLTTPGVITGSEAA